MTALLSELGKKIFDKWVTTLLLPGLLFAATAITAAVSGHRYALNPGHLVAATDNIVHQLTTPKAGVVLAILAILLGASAAALLAQSLSDLIQQILIARWPQWLVRARAKRAATSIERYSPHCISALGDAFYLLGQRIDVQYGLDVTLIWPRLWLLLPESMRATVQSIHSHYRSTLCICGWGVLYLALGFIWWPGVAVGMATIGIGYRRAVRSSAVLVSVIEATVDINQAELTTALGVPLRHGTITRPDGLKINNILDKRASRT